MKKVASLVGAGAILFSVVSVSFAWGGWGGVKQFSFTRSETSAEAQSGDNKQFGSGKQIMLTGDSESYAGSLTAGNVNVGSGKVTQFAGTSSETSAESESGDNTQMSFGRRHHGSVQVMGTGFSGAAAESITVSNVSVDLD